MEMKKFDTILSDLYSAKYTITILIYRESIYYKFAVKFINLDDQNSLSGKMIGATRDHMNKAAVAQLVRIRTQTDGQPTSTSFPLSPTDVDQPVSSMAEYMLAREKIKWKNEYEYVTGFNFSFSSYCSSALSSGSRGFPEPMHDMKPKLYTTWLSLKF